MSGKTNNKQGQEVSKKEASKPKLNAEGLQEITFLQDHGEEKKGDKSFRHPNTAKLLIDRKIAK